MTALTLDAMLDLERQGWDALCAQTGGDFYGSLMTDSAVMVLVNGFVMDRAAVVASLNGATAWDSYELSDARAVPVGEESSALVYRATARRGEEEPFEALMTGVYTLVDGTPRCTRRPRLRAEPPLGAGPSSAGVRGDVQLSAV